MGPVPTLPRRPPRCHSHGVGTGLGFARRGAQHRPSRRPRGGQEPRHAGRGRVVGIRRGAAVQAARPVGHGGDAVARIRGHGPAGRAGRPLARRGAAPPGGAAARCGLGVRGRRPARGATGGPPPVRAHAVRRTHGPAGPRVRRRPARGARRVRRGPAPREPHPRGPGRRRLFVLLPRAGRPIAVVHRIELQALADFPGEVRPYGAWRELHGHLEALVRGRTLAIEISPRDQVPYLDRVPYGVVELLESLGARLVSSAPLVSRFAARWSAAELAGHRKAAEILATVAREALTWVGSEAARGAEVRETGGQQRVRDAMERAGLWTDDGPIVAFGPTSAMPHYEPHAGADRRLAEGDVVLLDLWAGPGKGSVFADQTWMGFAGRSPDMHVRRVWQAVKAARDAAVRLLQERWGPDGAMTGAQVDDAARAVIRDAGLAEYFVHRTGHSIDRDLHGSGPHIDNFETEDARALVPGVGFSIEPGVYLPGRFGMRSEINVYIDTAGPEVNPSRPQDELILV